ncbi:MAG: DUF4126 domain-containing protein [Cyanobacteria bacterium J06635_1]
MMDTVNIAMALFLGIGLSAACGFRIFIPPFALSLAALNGTVELSPDWQWVGSYPAVTVFAIATVIEVLAYFVPWVNNALDSIEVFAAPVVGTFLTASTLSMAGEFNPVMTWVVAAIAGGGTAEVIEGASVLARFATAGLTAGVGTPAVSLAEMLSSIILSVLAILVPFLAFVLVIFLVIYCLRRLARLRRQRKRARQLDN